MKSEEFFMLRRGLVEAGFRDEAAEKVVSALENSMAGKIDDVMSKWEAKFDLKFELVRRDMTIRLGAMIFAAAGVIVAAIITAIKLLH